MPHVCQDRALDSLNSSRVRHPVDSGATRGRPVETIAAAPHPVDELRPGTWTRLMVAVMRLAGGPDLGILPGSGP